MDLAETINTININNDSPLHIKNFAAIIDGHHTEFVICNFANNITYIITQFGKIGNLYSVEAEQVENCIVDNEPVYHIRTLLGGDNIDIEAGIRYIAERLNSKKPLIFSLTLRNYTIGHLKLIIRAIKEYKPA